MTVVYFAVYLNFWYFICLHCSPMLAPNDQGIEEIERVLRERRPNSQNKDELLKLMAETRSFRLHWIASAKPDITTILKRYPRFSDLNASVSYKISFSWHCWLMFSVFKLGITVQATD